MSIQKKEVEKINYTKLTIHEVEENSVIVNVKGWRIRVYFDKDVNKDLYTLGKELEFKHYGDINNPHEVRFVKLK